jgi:hypothetical protein
MEKIIVELDVKSGDAEKNVGNVGNSLKELNKEATKATDKTQKGLEDTAKAAKKTDKSVGLLSKGFKGIGTALKAAGIGLFLSAITILFEVMRKNQKVLDAIETVTNLISLGFKAVTDALTDAFNSVNKATNGFDALKKVVGGLMTIALTPLKLLFYELKLAAEVLKVAYENIFGDEESVKNAQKNLDQTRLDILKVASDAVQAGKDIANNIVEAVGEVGAAASAIVKEVSKIDPSKLLDTAQAMTALKNNAEIAAAVQSGLVEKYDRLAEKQRQIRDEERSSISDRKKANDELLAILEKQEKAMLREADLQIANAKSELNAIDNQENRIKLIEAENNKLAVKAQITGLLSEQLVNDLALDRESIELTNSKAESESVLSIERQRFNAELIRNELERLEALKEIDQIEKDQETLRLEQIVLNANSGTQAKIDAQIALDEFQEQSRQLSLSREVEIDQAKIKSKENVLNALIGLSGAESALGKAGIIAKQVLLTKELLIDLGFIKSKATKTIVSANLDAASSGASVATGFSKTLALGFPAAIPALIGYAGAAVGIISSVKSAVGGAKSVASSIGGSGGAGGGNISSPIAPSIPTATSTPPSFNVVGSSDTNQLASAIGGQSQKPIKAFVVSSDVSTSQELDRNIITEAGIG